MFDFGPTFIWTIVNIFVLYLILKKILFKPVTNFMEERSRSIKNSIEESEKLKADAENLKKMYEDQLAKAKDDAARILSDARERAEREHQEIVQAARQEAEMLIARSKDEIERERQVMIKSIKSQVAGLALAAASKVIEANMDTEANRAIVDRFIKEEGVA